MAEAEININELQATRVVDVYVERRKYLLMYIILQLKIDSLSLSFFKDRAERKDRISHILY